MTTLRANVLCFLFVGAAVAVAVYLYPNLPEQIPTHWNIEGEVDDYMAKPWGVVIMPLAALFTFVIMRLIPIISPKGFRTDEFMDVVNVFYGSNRRIYVGRRNPGLVGGKRTGCSHQ